MQIRTSLSAQTVKQNLLPGSPFLSVLSMAPEERLAAIQDSEYGVYLDTKSSPENCWVSYFDSCLPLVKDNEKVVISRISQLLTNHHQLLLQPLSASEVWSHRNELFVQLKYLLAGDPFHVGTIFIYGLLESIQFERVRAILLLRAHQWPQSLLRGLA